MMKTQPTLTLNVLSFEELLASDGLHRLDQFFLDDLKKIDLTVYNEFISFRQGKCQKTSIEKSEWLISLAKLLEHFIARLFRIEEAVSISQIKSTSHNPISTFKKYFILRRAKKELLKNKFQTSFADINAWLDIALSKYPIQTADKELMVALLGVSFLEDPEQYHEEIEQLVTWCVLALTTPEGKTLIKDWVSFKIPERIDYENLVPVKQNENDPLNRLITNKTFRHRDGFALTDNRMSDRQVQDEVNYCIYCHDHEGDFCSRGFPAKKGDPSQGFKQNPLETLLTGCPLEEKISEMHKLKQEGHTIGALAMVMVDNPMCPATGHRICNDCMKACIYQKQGPVNIPQIETRTLTDVLDLPWGVEVYDLLTRWNPLRETQWVMKPYNGLKILIAGMGPAGFTLAHHLLLEGFAVVGFDGLKIESLPSELISSPIHRYEDLKESLDERLMAGFGGVAEYGITVRWDKNFLKLIYLSLLRRPYFQVFGQIRFGGTITIEDAWELGFDHFVVAVGAGLPKALSIPNSLNIGMRQANDFLMALQLGSAAKESSLNSLQIRLPAVVIGGGLTGVDTATELQAYYIRQVEKISKRFNQLSAIHGETFIYDQLDISSQSILKEFLNHAKAIQNERDLAKQNHRQPNFIKLIHNWGGVTIVYRKTIQESPAYINNHEELQKALEEGIFYLESLEPTSVDLDEFGHCQTLNCRQAIKTTEDKNKAQSTAKTISLAAKTILVATGTQPNTAYEFEHKGTFNRLRLQYQHYESFEGELVLANDVKHCKEKAFGPFTSYQKEDYRVSLVGDTHPIFHGSVVKAIASGLRTYPKIVKVLQHKIKNNADFVEYNHFASSIKNYFQSTLLNIEIKAPHILELTVCAPLAAKNFQPGQFYRLQNFERDVICLDQTELLMEPLALLASDCDHESGILKFIVFEETTSAKLCRLLKPNQKVSLMGPTGVRTKVPPDKETILIIGELMSLPFLTIYGKALKKANHNIFYFGEFNQTEDIYCLDKIKALSDFYCLKTKDGRVNDSKGSRHETDSSIINSLIRYAKELEPGIAIKDIDRIYVVGSTSLLKQFQLARSQILNNDLIKAPKIYGSVYGNMQCMLKGVCAQCLQWQVNPDTGERTKAVFACSWQDQPLEIIDIEHLAARNQQNYLHEKINQLWVDHLFKKYSL